MISLNTLSQLAEIDLLSQEKPVIIFKHSTRCSISSAALNRFENAYGNANSEAIPVYFLDLLQYRNISNEVARHYQIEHQSPQTLLIKNGKCVHEATHFDIDFAEIQALAI
jgi:bacillithiol system protein YtxJ